MKRVTTLWICTCFIFPGMSVLSQEYFNQSYDVSGCGLWSYGTTVLTNDSGYLIGAETCWSNNGSKRRISLVQLDLQGNEQWIKYYSQDSINSFGIGCPGFIIPATPNGYAITGLRRDPYPGWIRDRGILFRLNESYDTLWTQLYGDQVEPCDTELILRQVRQIKSGEFILYGEMMYYNDQRMHLNIIKTDTIGNQIWQKFYGIPPYMYFAYSFSATSDHGFILGGLRYTYPSDQGYDPIIFKTDNTGNEEWSLNLGSEFLDAAAFVDTSFDGNIIAGTAIADSMLFPDGSYRRICLTKVDNEGDIVWQKKYGTSYFDNRLWSIKSLSNGNIVATGSRQSFYPETPYRIGWIMCTNSEGDSLWYREYTLVQGEYSWNFLYDIVQANDSGFIACGYINPVSPDPGPQSTWVIKVDSIGCESPEYCWVGEEDPVDAPAAKGQLMVFPNPANRIVTVDICGEPAEPGARVVIYDRFGQKVYDEPLGSSGRVSLDVSDWSSGLYVVKMMSQTRATESVKIVVN